MAVVRRNSVSVQLSRAAHERLKTIAEKTGEEPSDVLDRAIEQEARRVFWQQFHEAVDRLRSNAEAWATYQAEGKELEGTLADGLNEDEDWSLLTDAQPDEIEFVDPEEERRA